MLHGFVAGPNSARDEIERSRAADEGFAGSGDKGKSNVMLCDHSLKAGTRNGKTTHRDDSVKRGEGRCGGPRGDLGFVFDVACPSATFALHKNGLADGRELGAPDDLLDLVSASHVALYQVDLQSGAGR